MMADSRLSASVLAAIIIGATGCSDRTAAGPDNAGSPVPIEVVVSNPHVISTNTSAAIRLASATVSGESVVYLSLPPKTLTNALYVRVRNQTTGGKSLLVPIIDGGFDPVPIEARAGDVLDLTIPTGGGTISMIVKVPLRRPPEVVRTDPPKGRTDVALNVTVTVVFSEPIDPKTLNATSLRLLHDGNPVSGGVRLLDNAWTAEFVPDNPLERQSSYELVATRDIRDLDGDSLTAPQSITFTTGTRSSQVLLTGFYVGTVTDTSAVSNGVPQRVISLRLEHSGERITGTWAEGGSSTPAGGTFFFTSSEGTFGAVFLMGQGDDFGDGEYITAEVTKPDGSELSGVWGYASPCCISQPTTEQPKPIVLRKI